MRSILLRTSRRLLSTAPPTEKKNIFRLPLKHQFKTQCINQTEQSIHIARSCNILAATFKENIEFFTDGHLLFLYKHLRTHQMQIDNSFHQTIAPISLQYLKVFNRQHAMVMYQMIMTMLELNIDNASLWSSLINKLDNQNCYRYIPLYETSLLLNKLLQNQQHRKSSLTRKLITVVHQQQEFYKNQPVCRPVIGQILTKLENFKVDQLQLTQAYKQLK